MGQKGPQEIIQSDPLPRQEKVLGSDNPSEVTEYRGYCITTQNKVLHWYMGGRGGSPALQLAVPQGAAARGGARPASPSCVPTQSPLPGPASTAHPCMGQGQRLGQKQAVVAGRDRDMCTPRPGSRNGDSWAHPSAHPPLLSFPWWVQSGLSPSCQRGPRGTVLSSCPCIAEAAPSLVRGAGLQCSKPLQCWAQSLQAMGGYSFLGIRVTGQWEGTNPGKSAFTV